MCFDKGRSPLKTYLGESIPSFYQKLTSKILLIFNAIYYGTNTIYLIDSKLNCLQLMYQYKVRLGAGSN